jgi:hypothetical protein
VIGLTSDTVDQVFDTKYISDRDGDEALVLHSDQVAQMLHQERQVHKPQYLFGAFTAKMNSV